MPRIIETAAMTTVGTAVCVANMLHPLFHAAEGGTVDTILQHATQYALVWIDSRSN